MSSLPSSPVPPASERLIVALDFPSAALALDIVKRLEGTCRWFKVGMELFYGSGGGIVEELRSRGFHVFLDLKLHDIPNTVAGAIRSVTSLGASLLTVHAGGGLAMMEAARDAASASGAPRLLAVTVLTSMDTEQLGGVGITSTPADQVLRLGRLAHRAGIDGLVCSPREVTDLRAAIGSEMLLVTPGIRGAADAVGDQKRVASACVAIQQGASKLVVGRPITQAADPASAANSLLEEIARAEAV